MEDSNNTAESHTAPTPQQAATPAPPDEDLIDYSDEDDYDEPSIVFPHAQEPVAGDAATATPADSGQGASDAVHETQSAEQSYKEISEVHGTADDHSEGDDGGVQLQDYDDHADASEHHDDYEDHRSIETRPITVNYEGNELWLFKQHDTDDSGDWLTDDISLIHSSLSDLFQACRAALGEDISNETELGLRFDHFHNMEIYEDSTACVAVSLERMVELYHALQAQDGRTDPESFYMCLLSRPRFASLLSDVAKYAEQGSGYSAFNAAVAAGETHFVDQFSEHTTPHEDAEWDNADGADDGEHQEGTESAGEDGLGVELQEHDGNSRSEEEAAADEHDHPSVPATATHSEYEADASQHATPHHADVEEPHQQATTNPSPEQDLEQQSEAQKEQLSKDTVDYSDQEDDAEPQKVVSHDGSLSSTTLQVDHSVTDEASVPVPEETEVGNEGHDHDYLNGEYDFHAGTEELYDQDDNAESYQEYDQGDAQAYDQGEPLGESQASAAIAYPAEADLEGLTNQEYNGYDHDDLDQQLENDFISGADLDGIFAGESLNDANDNDFLDLDSAPEWANGQENISALPDDAILVNHEDIMQDGKVEDGGLEQPVVAASSAADPVAASSTDLHQVSPQGQKRSIDEVGDTVDDVTDLTGTLWARRSLTIVVGANVFPLDMKRPRV
ncbi:hypothetical protein DE146DRAFT_606995 [Phaeosphaeria sp. MPI-PUGE-AT-0046c]|nr:hypothetical protein DE146DRAFT_606995 [Phaeosphaeria sp. MPI-PUGE-AT-0046c]